jgi:hypothetical protein
VNAGAQTLGPAAWRRIAIITAAALALYAVVRELPTGTNLSHMDFRVQGGNSIEFCDPGNPQFLPVVSVRSPVALAIATAAEPRAGGEADATLTLQTFGGKPIAPEDLLTVHTRRIHLMIVDASLEDYQHVHPEPGRVAGQWTFRFRPRFGGTYRFFADFTPVATNRGLYASADLEVRGDPNPAPERSRRLSWVAEESGCRFALVPGSLPIRAGRPADLKLVVTRLDGSAVPLEPVMGAFAHLVAFDAGRTGFAHLHPNETDLSHPPDSVRPALTFKVAIPSAGRYVIWAQVNLGGRDAFAPFWFDVSP